MLITNIRAANLDALRDREHAVMRQINAARPTHETQKGTYY
jgi:hypothetical protein